MKSLVVLVALWAVSNGQFSSCPANEAFRHNGFWYQFFDCPLSWQQAQNTCKNRMVVNGKTVTGGNLVSILDKDESEWLKFQLDMRYGAKVGVWTGLRRQNRQQQCSRNFVWADGSRFDFEKWDKDQPNCFWPGEDCIHLIDNENWNDAECDAFMRFVCKIKLPTGPAFDLGGK